MRLQQHYNLFNGDEWLVWTLLMKRTLQFVSRLISGVNLLGAESHNMKIPLSNSISILRRSPNLWMIGSLQNIHILPRKKTS